MQKKGQMPVLAIILIILIIIVAAVIIYFLIRNSSVTSNVILSINCNNDNDCGISAYSGGAFCDNNVLYQNYITYVCNNPGSTSSSCSISTRQQLKESCYSGCSNGRCNNNCIPQCAGRECGNDGCSGNCGICPSGQACTNGQCANPTYQTYRVSIVDYSFSPSNININSGDTVIWTNNGQMIHTVTSTSGNELNSGTLNAGNSYSHTFMSSGNYNYYCTVHPSMLGSVRVN